MAITPETDKRMSDNGNGNGRGSALARFPWQVLAFAASLIAQTWWIGSKIGTMDTELLNVERRLSTLETQGSPALIGMKTDLAVLSRNIAILEDILRARVPEGLMSNARQDERITVLQRDLERLTKIVADHLTSERQSELSLRSFEAEVSVIKDQIAKLQAK